VTIRATTAAACVLALCCATAADAKKASFTVSVTGSQTTRVASSVRCSDASGSTATRSGQLSESTDFRTTRPGRVAFATGAHGAVTLRQSTGMLAAGTAQRDSSLDERGITPGACAEVTAATGCGSQAFGDWRLSLSGGLYIRLGAGSVSGGDPFRACQNPFDGFPHLVRRISAHAGKKALFNRKKKVVKVGGVLDETRAFADGYTGAKGTAATSLRYTAVLTRR
jgi:hypothetical protein